MMPTAWTTHIETYAASPLSAAFGATARLKPASHNQPSKAVRSLAGYAAAASFRRASSPVGSPTGMPCATSPTYVVLTKPNGCPAW